MSMKNRVQLIGNLGKDPEIRYMPNGNQVCQLSLATTERWRDKESGERRESTEWHRVVFYEPLSKVCGEYLSKGRQIVVEGQLRTRKYTKDGRDVYVTEVIGTEMQMLDSADGGDGDKGAQAAVAAAQSGGSSGDHEEDYGHEGNRAPMAA